jgi:hypothetical protein
LLLKEKITANLGLQILIGFICETDISLAQKNGSESFALPHGQVVYIAREKKVTWRK